MTANELEQIKRILDPAVRETVRAVLEEEMKPHTDRIVHLESEVALLKQLRGKMLGAWTVIVLIATLIGKALWDFIVTPWFRSSNP